MSAHAANSRVVWCALTPLGKMIITTIATHKMMTRMALIDGIRIFTWRQAQAEGFKLIRVRVAKISSRP